MQKVFQHVAVLPGGMDALQHAKVEDQRELCLTLGIARRMYYSACSWQIGPQQGRPPAG